MTLNRIPEDMHKDIKDLQVYYELTRRMKNHDKYYYWESCRRMNSYLKTLPFRNNIDNTLTEFECSLFYMRYVLKYPIIKIVQQTGYSKRMIQYKLNDIIIKLKEGPEVFRYIKKYRLQQEIIKRYVTHNIEKKVQ